MGAGVAPMSRMRPVRTLVQKAVQGVPSLWHSMFQKLVPW